MAAGKPRQPPPPRPLDGHRGRGFFRLRKCDLRARSEGELARMLNVSVRPRRWIHLSNREARAVSESDFEREFRTRTGSAQ